jgi:Cd2+/Zn2+-exporting ATPase
VTDAPGEVKDAPGHRVLEFHVEGMNCPDCVRRVRDRLANVDGVHRAEGSPVARRLTVTVDETRVDGARIRRELGKIGFVARDEGATDAPSRIWSTPHALRTYVSGTLFGVALLLELIGVGTVPLQIPPDGVPWADLLFLTAALIGGWNFIPAGLRALGARSLDMNFLMTVAILGAIGIGEHLEAGAIAFLFSLAELLEGFAVERARRSIHALMQLSPDRARLLTDGEEVLVAADELQRGDVVVVRGGDKIPADGTVLEGDAAVDESTITGESIPADRSAGEEVFAGTICAGGYLKIHVTRVAGETTLAGIVRIVEEAEARRSRTERFVDRFARYYTPSVTVAAVLIVVIPTLVFGGAFSTWFVRGLTLLVIACPCALVISTPVAVVSGITAAARHGVLIKSGQYLEAMGGIATVAFDKTGTLTHGHPEVTEVIALRGTEEEVLSLAAAAESRAEHPIARAIVQAAEQRGLSVADRVVGGFQSHVGSGVRALVDGKEVRVGSADLFAAAAPREQLAALRESGKTAVLVGPPGAPLGIVAVADRPREAAPEAIRSLRSSGLHTVMLTGDHRETANAIAAELGIDEVYAGLKPADKVDVVRQLEADHGHTAMVGDGVNDGPALAVASVGIAMGAAGSDVALETADVALMSDDLSRLPYLHALSRRGRGVIRQNIIASLVAKLALAIGVPFGLVSLVAAVLIGDMGASLAVTTNALRLARVRPPSQRAGAEDRA